MSLPTTPSDLPYPPGDSWAVRSGAAGIRSTLDQLGTARTAALHIEDITGGAHWRGEAFEAFARVIERQPLRLALDRAQNHMIQAADRLDWFAGRFEANTETIRWCRSRLASLAIDGGGIPDELVPEVQRIQWDAERAWDDHRTSSQHVADLFDWLDDQPTFAPPPPSNWDRVRGAAGHVWSFGVGAVEATWDMATFAAEIMVWVNPLTAPFKWHETWENRAQIAFLLRYAWDHPGEFGAEVGKAVVDLDTLRDDGVARWLGHRVPELVLALATAGFGSVQPLFRTDTALRRLALSGLTGQLVIIDGLLVGVPALSPESHAAMVAVLGLSVVEGLGGRVGIGVDVAGVAAAQERDR